MDNVLPPSRPFPRFHGIFCMAWGEHTSLRARGAKQASEKPKPPAHGSGTGRPGPDGCVLAAPNLNPGSVTATAWRMPCVAPWGGALVGSSKGPLGVS